MPITKRPQAKPAPEAAGDAFIDQAPDAKPARWQRGSKTQITFGLDPELLDRIDQAARKGYLSLAALMMLWLNERLQQEAGGA